MVWQVYPQRAFFAARGHRVTVLEKNDWIGGKAAVHRDQGYRFDMGPTILTLPSILRRVFSEAGRKLEDYIELVALDPQWRCFFDGDSSRGEENTVLDLVSNTDQMVADVDQLTGSSSNGEGYRRFLDMSEGLHGGL